MLVKCLYLKHFSLKKKKDFSLFFFRRCNLSSKIFDWFILFRLKEPKTQKYSGCCI